MALPAQQLPAEPDQAPATGLAPEPAPRKPSVVVLSGDMDRVMAAFLEHAQQSQVTLFI